MQHHLPAFSDALTSDDEARSTFSWMGDAHQEAFLGWITSALTEVESLQRIQAVVDMLAGRDLVNWN